MNPQRTAELFLSLLPEDGTFISNTALRRDLEARLKAEGLTLTDDDYWAVRAALIGEGVVLKGQGRGGRVRRNTAQGGEDFDLTEPTVTPVIEKPPPAAQPKPSARANPNETPRVIAYRHADKRVNNPEVGLVTPFTDPEEGKRVWAYDPHIPASILAAVRKEFFVSSDRFSEGDSPSSKQKTKNSQRITQFDLFNAPFENLPPRQAIDFYRHERGWANRLIAGDSLLVMNSLLQKESLAGRVQMIYIDPPYGIKYGSNFQPFINKRDVKDRNDADLTQEPEMLKAFRDTWELGIHSYLTYLRDRLLLARELLAESGSVFGQISDENLHHVREIMDEVFGAESFISLITVQKTTSSTNPHLSGVADYLVWYGKQKEKAKCRELYRIKEIDGAGAEHYKIAQFSDGRRVPVAQLGKYADNLDLSTLRRLTAADLQSAAVGRDKGEGAACWFSVEHEGNVYLPNEKSRWKTNEDGIRRIARAGRAIGQTSALRYARFLDDFPAFSLHNVWTDFGGAPDRRYVVETNAGIIERCLLMATDPGDLVLDPTCGSGTTAFVAEKWGRRWITCDTSRVAVTLAKQRLMTASYDYYELKYPHEGLKGGFIYKTVPHVTLKSIANNPDIDTIYERMHPAIAAALAKLNEFLVRRFAFLVDGDKTDFTGYPLKEWEAPFELTELESFLTRHGADPVQLKTQNTQLATLLQHVHEARLAMQREMDRSIAAHADQETLYDQPAISKSKLRVSGPFTVEAVPFPTVKSLDEASGPEEADASIARTGESGRQHQWRDELLKTGIRGKGGQMLKFADLEALPADADIRNLHATGHLESGERVVVSFGPEYAALEQRQVSNALNEAGNLFPLPKMIVFCAFMFDPEAAKDIDAIKGITALKAQMNTDLLTEDLKKNRASNQSYWLMGQPEVEVLSLAFLVFGERRLCDYDGFAKLSGLDCLAKIHGLGREDLFLYALLTQGRAVWDYLANAQGWDLHTGEYRRGTGKKRPGSESSGIPAVSWHGERLVGGVGDLDFALRQAGLPRLGEFRDVIAGLRRHSETPRRLAQVAHALDFPLSQLGTENTQLTTFHQVEVHGFDYFDTVKGELVSGGKSKIAMWALDPDYDERSLFPRQVFFPMAGKGEGWEKLKKNIRAELDESRLQQFQGAVSLPFAAGENRKIAVKIIDDRGIESLKVMPLGV